MIRAHRDDAAPFERRWEASVELELERQIGLNWCWAAVAKGIVEHYGGPTLKQCQYATKFLQQPKSCCGRKAPESRCDLPHDVDSVLARYGVYAAPPFRRPVQLTTLRREIERDRPVVALVRFPSAVHAVAITAVDVEYQRLGVCDPGGYPARREVRAAAFTNAYKKHGRWCYTILTRPRPGAAQRATISMLRDRMPQDRRRLSHVPRESSEPLEIDLYELDPFQLAAGTGLQTPERFLRESFRLDVFATTDGELYLDQELTALRDEIGARLERGFELRIVRCFAYKFEALWFTDPADTSHRTDHYIPIPPVPYYLEEGREYGTAELRDALVEISPVALAGIEANRKWIERLDRETEFQPDDPTI